MLWSQHSGRVVVFCRAINETFPEKAIAAQRIDSLWYIYIKDDGTKNKLIIDGFKLDSVTIPVYSVNPYGSNQRNNDINTEKIVIQKLALHVNNNSISDFLKKYSQVKPTSVILIGN